jgi:myosin heavy subunit
LDKNKDPLQEDLQTAMKKSTVPLVASLFLENITGIGEVDDGKGKRSKGVNFVTVAAQYKVQWKEAIADNHSRNNWQS